MSPLSSLCRHLLILGRDDLYANPGWIPMRRVFSVNDISWQNLRGLPGARGFEYKALSDGDYSSAFNAELVRLEPGDHSVPHIEPWSHLLYFLSGTGDVTIDGETQPVATGTVCQISAGQKHSLRNLGKAPPYPRV